MANIGQLHPDMMGKRSENKEVTKNDTKELLDLILSLANASATTSCGGHHKGNMNDQLVTKYTKELKEKYQILVLEDSHNTEDKTHIYYPPCISQSFLNKIGIFNGDGSY